MLPHNILIYTLAVFHFFTCRKHKISCGHYNTHDNNILSLCVPVKSIEFKPSKNYFAVLFE